jgi:hypothetical protein
MVKNKVIHFSIIYIKNLQSFIGLYKFCAKSDFHEFIQKLHEFHVMVNTNDIFTYSIS